MDRSNLNIFVFSEFVLGDASKDLQEENPKNHQEDNTLPPSEL